MRKDISFLAALIRTRVGGEVGEVLPLQRIVLTDGGQADLLISGVRSPWKTLNNQIAITTTTMIASAPRNGAIVGRSGDSSV